MKYCIFTVIKDEHDYLDEWLEYHLKLGIDKIYIYEDITNEKTHADIVAKYDNVKLHSCKELTLLFSENRQLSYFRIFLNNVSKLLFDWCFYIDVDEYLTLNERHNLDNVFGKFNDYDAIAISWQNYNANGHIEKPTGNIQNNYIQKCGFIERHIKDHSMRKLAINLKKYVKEKLIFNIHCVFDGKWCNTDFSTDPSRTPFDEIFIRHYITKSFEEYVNKIYLSGQFYNSKRIDDFFELNPELLDKKDAILQKYSSIIESHRLPKKLHYIWFGSEKPELTKKCIESWYKYANDYEIIEWNESNLKDVQLTKLEAMCFLHFYKAKQYAFASDIIRLKVLYQYGGIYIDTDVELIKQIPDFVRDHNILALDKFNLKPNNGNIMGMFPKDETLKQIIDCFNNELSKTMYLLSYGKGPKSIFNELLYAFLKQYIRFYGDKMYTFKNLVIYPSEYFCPIDFITKKCTITNNTISIHHYAASWHKYLNKN